MAIWQNSAVILVRSLISDLGIVQTFTDQRICTAFVVAGLITSNELTFQIPYTFDLEAPDISPDPFTNFDPLAVGLFSLKCACLLDINKLSDTAPTAVEIRDGDTLYSGNNKITAYEVLLKMGSCASYDRILKQQRALASNLTGKGLFGGGISHESFLLSGTGFGGYASTFFNGNAGLWFRGGGF